MPANSLGDSSSQCGGTDDPLQNGIRPERISSLAVGAGEYPIIGLPISGCLLPQPQISGHTHVQGDRLAGCFRLAIAKLSQINGALHIEVQIAKVNITPSQGK